MERRNASRLAALAAAVIVGLGAVIGFFGRSADDRVNETVASSTAASGQVREFSADAGPVAAPTTGVDQKIVKDATVRIEVGKGSFRDAFNGASHVAGAHGGFVVSSESASDDDGPSRGSLVLRVPVAAFDAARADLAKMGKVKSETINGSDVSGQVVDLDARLRSLTAQEDATRALLAKANTIAETIEVQGQLTQIRQQIEQLAGQKARLENQAALSTIRLELGEVGAAAPQRPADNGSIRDAVSAAVDGAETVVAGTIIVLGWAIPLALLAVVGWLVSRPIRNRLRTQAVTP